MKLNMDFDKKVVISTNDLEWIPSPAKDVLRKPLEREAAESGHVSSIVKYEAGASFKTHHHPLGEEIFVLEGTFSDEFGDYPQGSYLRNPPGSSHAPYSKEGCTIFVKLNQTALVKWPKGERFIPHKHWGGEEILVLSGEFKDEYGTYPEKTWIRSPHLSTHHPFVTEETIILVKTGHLLT